MAVTPRVVEGDLLDQDVDAIVNSWNPQPHSVLAAASARRRTAPSGNARAPRPSASSGAAACCRSARRSPAARAACRTRIIHVAGVGLRWLSSERAVRDSVRNALRVAAERRFVAIAFFLIGAGVGGGAADRVLAWMRSEMAELDFAGEVRIVLYRPKRDL